MDSVFASHARSLLNDAVAQGVPGVVAMAGDRNGVTFSAAAGLRRAGGDVAMTEDTVFALFSCTKALTATAALRLVEDGRLDLDAPVRDILPGLGEIGVFDGYGAGGAPKFRRPKREITARMLMLHTAGFGYDFANPIVRKLLDDGHIASHRSATLAGFAQPLVNEPGERWEYGTSIDWLGMTLEAIVGERLDAILERLVLAPLDMRETAHAPTAAMTARLAAMHQREPDGSVTVLAMGPRVAPEVMAGGGGMYGTVGDFMRFLRMWLNDGAGVLKPETVAWAVRDGLDGLDVPALPSVDPKLSGPVDFHPGTRKGWAYSFLYAREPLPTGRPAGSLSWGGLGNLYYWIDRENGICGFWASQLFPFLDKASLAASLAFETAFYQALRRGGFRGHAGAWT